MAKKRKKVSVRDVLKQIPEKELRSFVAKQLSNQEVLDDFMTEFKKYFMQGDSAEAYVSQLINAFLDAEDCDEDWMNFSRQSHLASTVREIAEAAAELRDAGNYEGTIDIFFTILEYGIDCVNHNDDSMGYLGGIMYKGIQGLSALADSKVCMLDDDSREAFMDRCWTCIAENTFEGWDWHTDMYEFLITLANCEDEYENIMESLDEDDYFKSEWNQKRQLELKGELLLKWKGAEAAHQMMIQNLQIQEYREKVIQEAMESSDYQRAYRLALDGIAQDEKERPGIVPTWNHWMVRIAQKDGNHEFVIKYASLLYLDPFNQHDDFYAILKKEVPVAEWDDFAQKLAQQALDTKHAEKYADICSREKWTDKLMEYVRKRKSIHDLEHYEAQLLKDYREEIIAMYVNHANWLMTNSYNRDRSTYKEMCRHLDHAVKLGGYDQVRDTIEMLRNNYKRCRALMEELNRIQLERNNFNAAAEDPAIIPTPEFEHLFDSKYLDMDCDRIGDNVSGVLRNLEETYKTGAREIAIKQLLQLALANCNHFISEEHWCYFDDVYSPEYCYDRLLELIAKDIAAGVLPEELTSLLSAGLKTISKTECVKEYGYLNLEEHLSTILDRMK